MSDCTLITFLLVELICLIFYCSASRYVHSGKDQADDINSECDLQGRRHLPSPPT
jgi:hypothetical protein